MKMQYPWQNSAQHEKADGLTIEGDSQKESVGDVQHHAAQQVEHVHVALGAAQLLQLLQMLVGGGHADLQSPLQPWTCQR